MFDLPTPLVASRRILSLILVFGVFTSAWFTAQTAQPKLHVNDVEVQEPVPGAAGLPGVSLGLNFTVLDANDEVMADAQPASATVDIGTGQPYTATVQAIDVPWSIVLVVDASKTLTGYTASAAFKTARFALADTTKQAPRDSNIAVLTFGSQPATILDFTRDNDTLQTALRTRIRAQSDQNPCLNDGVYEAVNKLSGASGRRAVLIFTASADGCGQRPAKDVVDLAQRNHIQVYGVGLRGYSISEGELQALTEPTGGLATLREEGDLVFGFQNVMNVLAHEWEAKATLYPTAGPQSAEFGITFKDGSILMSDPVQFTSAQSYDQPPAITLRGQVQSISTGLRFNLNLVSPSLINQLNVNVVSKATGDSVASQTVTAINEANEIAADNLVVGDEYTLVVQAMDSRGQMLSQTSADFKYEPAAPVLTVRQVEPPTDAQPAYLIQVDSANLENAVKYKAWLTQAEAQGGTAVPVTTAPQIVPVGDPLTIPVADLATGTYQAVVQALDSDNNVLAQATSDAFSYKRPSAFEAFVKSVGQTRLAILSTTLLCVAVFAVVVVAAGVVLLRRSSRPKSVDLVLPERKFSAPAPISQPSFDSPSQEFDGRAEAAPARAEPPPRAEPPVKVPPACVSSHESTELQFSAPIDHSPFTIGRREGNDLVVRVSNRSGMSGRHVTVTFSGGRFYIQDDFSSFGTRLNDTRLQPGVPVPLADGAIIELGPSVKIKFALKNCDE